MGRLRGESHGHRQLGWLARDDRHQTGDEQERIQGCGQKRCGIVERAEQPERRATGCAGQSRGRSYATSLDHAVRGQDPAKHDCQIRNQPEDADLEKGAKVLVVEDPVGTRVIGI